MLEEKNPKLQQMVFGKLNVHVYENEMNLLFVPLHTTNSKWIKDLNVKPEIPKLLEENTGSTL